MNAEYIAYLNSASWRERADEIRWRDDDRCRMCGATWNLQVHHINYDGYPHNEPDYNLVTVCAGCHLSIHGKYGESWDEQTQRAAMAAEDRRQLKLERQYIFYPIPNPLPWPLDEIDSLVQNK